MVERTNTIRRAQRSAAASPYKRPSSKRANETKKSGIFSAVSNLISSFWRRDVEETEDSDYEEALVVEPSAAAEALVERGLDLQVVPPVVPAGSIFQDPQPPQPLAHSPPHTAIVSPPRSQASPSSDDRMNNIEVVTNFLAEHRGRPMNPVEVEGVISLLRQVKENEQERPEPFRFSSTPARDATPALAGPSNGARKLLPKNPNGSYVWRGGGSAKPKNRYSSPGFTSTRAAPTRMKLSPEKPKPKTDGKRRRIDSEPEASSSSSTSASPGRLNGTANHANGFTSPPEVNKVVNSSTVAVPGSTRSPSPAGQPSSKLNGAATAPTTGPRIRTAGMKPPTAPSVPSPLRQTWGQTDSPSPPSSINIKPTRAANILSELVRETAPRPPSIFSNPYEAASPVPVPVRPVKKSSFRRRAAPGTSTTPTTAVAATTTTITTTAPLARTEGHKPEAELSPQKIIEATIPKGAKRSRPPPDLSKQHESAQSGSGPRRSARLKSPEPPSHNGRVSAFRSNIASTTIEEVADEEGPSPKKAKTNGVARPLQPALEIPDRSSVTVEEVNDVNMSSTPTEAASKVILPSQVIEPEPTPEPDSSSRLQIPSFASPFGGVIPGPKANVGTKYSAPAKPSMLRYSIRADEEDSPKVAAKELPQSLGMGFPSSRPGTTASFEPKPSQSSASLAEVSSTRTQISPFAAIPERSPKTTAQIKEAVIALPVFELPQYTFEFGSSSMPDSGTTAKSKAAALAVPGHSLPSYDFSSSSSLAPGSSSTSSSKPTTGGFDWAAAGLKVPTKPADTWDCADCGLSNPSTALTKCQVCEAPKPGASKVSSAQASAPIPPAAPVGGFNWAAAGMKPPSAAAGWKCSTCMLDNPDSVNKCTVCETPR
ncbi:hypothetical protein BDW22DRAFT_1419894 [Trametopsis cervina]|nr:hypothetical protein BDW22DRAFT_1419894 [Trametopsis cervina]